MSFLRKLFKKKNKYMQELYDEKDTECLEEYISEKFGKFDSVYHEIMSPDIHVDIVIIEPKDGHDYYTLITMGMGAHKMNVPKDLAEQKLNYAEIVVNLPKDWQVKNDKEEWYWPLRWLKILARLPLENKTWLGFGHTIPNGEPFSDDTKLNCVLLTNTENAQGESAVALLPSGKNINFYTMVPLYEEEVNYKLESDADVLLNKLKEKDICYPFILDKNRKNVCVE